MKKRIVSVVLIICMLASLSACGGSTESEAEGKNTSYDQQIEETPDFEELIENEEENLNGKDKTPRAGKDRAEKGDNPYAMTIMIYMTGSNLESVNKAGTQDIKEMVSAKFSDDVKVLLQTGGASTWHNKSVGKTVQRHILTENKLTTVEDLGNISMVESSTLTDFLVWGASEFPADRYGVILWDHGGGPLGGYGADDFYPGEGLDLVELQQAFRNTNINFDFIGFDACLMATFEVSYALCDYADYLIASEELEAYWGWYYTDWISALSNDPYMSIEEIANHIITPFMNVPSKAKVDSTLSVIDLGQMADVYRAINEYNKKCETLLAAEDYKSIYNSMSKARIDSRNYGLEYENDGRLKNSYEMVDVLDYINNNEVAIKGTSKIDRTIRNAVIERDNNVVGSFGISMYFPFYKPEYYSYVKNILLKVGFTKEYFGFYDRFLSIKVAGSGEEANGSWYTNPEAGDSVAQEETGTAAQDNYEIVMLEDGTYMLPLIQSGGNTVVPFSEEDWESIASVKMQFYGTYGDYRVLLGTEDWYGGSMLPIDNSYLQLKYNKRVLTIDGVPVSYNYFYSFIDEAGNQNRYLTVPAELRWDNDKNIENIKILIQERIGTGGNTLEVLGYLLDSENDKADRGYYNFYENDVVRYTINTYDNKWNDLGMYYFYDDQKVLLKEMKASFETIDTQAPYYVRYMIVDTYNRELFTDRIKVK